MRFRSSLLLVATLFTLILPAAIETQEAPDTIVLKGATRRAVTFAHVTHAELADCVRCHHESKPEKPAAAEYEKCHSCHTETVTEPMKTNLRDAFHDQRGKSGVCVDCHLEGAAAGKTTPARCVDCHKPEAG